MILNQKSPLKITKNISWFLFYFNHTVIDLIVLQTINGDLDEFCSVTRCKYVVWCKNSWCTWFKVLVVCRTYQCHVIFIQNFLIFYICFWKRKNVSFVEKKLVSFGQQVVVFLLVYWIMDRCARIYSYLKNLFKVQI